MHRFSLTRVRKHQNQIFRRRFWQIWSHGLTRGLLGHVAPPKQPALWRTRRRRRSTRRGAATARPAARRRSGHKAPAARGCREQRLRPRPPSSRGLAGEAATRWRSGRGGRQRGGPVAAGAGGRGRGRAASPCTRRCPVVAPAPLPGGRPRCRRPSPGPRLRRRRRVRHGEGLLRVAQF